MPFCSRIFHIFAIRNQELTAVNNLMINQIKEVFKKGIKQTWFIEKIGKSYSQTNVYACNCGQLIL